jgi:hypothetical protein
VGDKEEMGEGTSAGVTVTDGINRAAADRVGAIGRERDFKAALSATGEGVGA